MSYPGGKSGSGVYQIIINQMPQHSIYIEPFLGGGAVMKYKKPAPLANIAIDADAEAIHNFGIPPGVPNYQGIAGNALDWLESADVANSGDTLIYCDPPYLMSTRSSQRQIYRWELCDADHIRLLDILQQLAARGIMVMLSGYPSDLYDNTLRDWRRKSFYAMTRSGEMAQEVLWMSYPEPWELHDYQFLGNGFRERERIKRKKQRWVKRLESMDSLERAALMQAVAQVRNLPATSPKTTVPADSVTYDDACRQTSLKTTVLQRDAARAANVTFDDAGYGIAQNNGAAVTSKVAVLANIAESNEATR